MATARSRSWRVKVHWSGRAISAGSPARSGRMSVDAQYKPDIAAALDEQDVLSGRDHPPRVAVLGAPRSPSSKSRSLLYVPSGLSIQPSDGELHADGRKRTVTQLPFADGEFDGVTCQRVLHHGHAVAPAFAESSCSPRLLNRRGVSPASGRGNATVSFRASACSDTNACPRSWVTSSKGDAARQPPVDPDRWRGRSASWSRPRSSSRAARRSAGACRRARRARGRGARARARASLGP